MTGSPPYRLRSVGRLCSGESHGAALVESDQDVDRIRAERTRGERKDLDSRNPSDGSLTQYSLRQLLHCDAIHKGTRLGNGIGITAEEGSCDYTGSIWRNVGQLLNDPDSNVLYVDEEGR